MSEKMELQLEKYNDNHTSELERLALRARLFSDNAADIITNDRTGLFFSYRSDALFDCYAILCGPRTIGFAAYHPDNTLGQQQVRPEFAFVGFQFVSHLKDVREMVYGKK